MQKSKTKIVLLKMILIASLVLFALSIATKSLAKVETAECLRWRQMQDDHAGLFSPSDLMREQCQNYNISL